MSSLSKRTRLIWCALILLAIPILVPWISLRGGACTVYQIDTESASLRKQFRLWFINFSTTSLDAGWRDTNGANWVDWHRSALLSRIAPELYSYEGTSLFIDEGFYFDRLAVDKLESQSKMPDEVASFLRHWVLDQWRVPDGRKSLGARFFDEQYAQILHLASKGELGIEELRGVLGRFQRYELPGYLQERAR